MQSVYAHWTRNRARQIQGCSKVAQRLLVNSTYQRHCHRVTASPARPSRPDRTRASSCITQSPSMNTLVLARTALRRHHPRSIRPFASAGTPPQSPSWPLYLAAAGAAGLGAWAYLQRTSSSSSPSSSKQEKSPLDSDKFIPFTLKKVEPYNHNTAK